MSLLRYEPRDDGHTVRARLVCNVRSLFRDLGVRMRSMSPSLLPIVAIVPPASAMAHNVQSVSCIGNGHCRFSHLIFLISQQGGNLGHSRFGALLVSHGREYTACGYDAICSLWVPCCSNIGHLSKSATEPRFAIYTNICISPRR